jgi:hypothetical protein
VKTILSGRLILHCYVFNLRACKGLLAALLVAALGSCVAFDGYPERATDPTKDLESLGDLINGAAVKACLENSDIACRNKLIAARMNANDIKFSQFEERLFRQTREAGFSATLATLGLTTTAAFASGGVSPILSGIAAFIIGGREAYQKEVLAERTVIAIHTAMRARRAEVALRLHTGLGQPIDQYPVALGLADLNEYYNAGTVLGALIGITETIGAEARRAEDKLQGLRTNVFAEDESADKIRTFIWPPRGDPSDPVNAANVKAVQDWINRSPVADLPIANFLSNADLKDLRERAIQEIPVP